MMNEQTKLERHNAELAERDAYEQEEEREDLFSFVNVAAAQAMFGETEYAYYRVAVLFCSGRKRGDEKHVSCTPVACSREEYEAKFAEGQRLDHERFAKGAAQFRRDFNRYERKVAKPGWRERLIELIQQVK